MAYTTAGGTKKKVCYYYDGMGHPECLERGAQIEASVRLTLAAQLVCLASVAGGCAAFNTS